MSDTQLAKIAVSTQAGEALASSLETVNADFLGGRVTKTSLASWLIINASRNLTEENIEVIRRANFNQVSYLEGLAKKLKTSGQESLNEKELEELSKLFGVRKIEKTKKKPQGTESTDVLKDQNAA